MGNDIAVGTESMGFCVNTANVWQIVGYVLLIVKIVIPVLLIIWGILDLGKAVVAAKDDEIKKATKSLAFRAISAVVIFFIPTIVNTIFGMISGFTNSGAQDDWTYCRSCITSPNGDVCNDAASEAWGLEQ